MQINDVWDYCTMNFILYLIMWKDEFYNELLRVELMVVSLRVMVGLSTLQCGRAYSFACSVPQ